MVSIRKMKNTYSANFSLKNLFWNFLISCGGIFWLYFFSTARAPVRHFVIKRNIASKEGKDSYKQIKDKLRYGDWFLLNHLSKRMVGSYFSHLIQLFQVELKK